jgi:hypothetical protein
VDRRRVVESLGSALTFAVVFGAMALARAVFRRTVPLEGVPPPGNWDFVSFPALTASLVFVVVFGFGLAGANLKRQSRPFSVRRYVTSLVVILALAGIALVVYALAR